MGKETVDNKDSAPSDATSGALFLIFSQVLSKLLTFCLNQFLLRQITPRVLGINSYFEFLVATLLFLSREGERLAIQRTELRDKSNERLLKNDIQSIINFGWIPFTVGSMGSLTASFWLWYGSDYSIELDYYYKCSIIIYAFLAILELSFEPIYALNQFMLNFKLRSKSESVAIGTKCAATFASMYYFRSDNHATETFEGQCILSFALGQLAYASTLSIFYFGEFFKENMEVNLIVLKIEEERSFYFKQNVLSYWKSVLLQLTFKEVLTERDHVVMHWFSSIEDQGTYALVSNYGSMIARIVFAPIEETVRLTFTKLLQSKERDRYLKSKSWLSGVCLFYFYILALAILAGYQNSEFVLRVLLGRSVEIWENTNVFAIFPAYVLYIPFMAFNGVLEAFFDSAADFSSMKRLSMFMSCLSVIMVGVLYLLLETAKFGSLGMILSNDFDMLIRIVYCLFFIKSYFGLKGLIVSFSSCFQKVKLPFSITLAVFLGQRSLLGSQSTNFKQFLTSALICTAYLSFVAFYERNLIRGYLSKTK